jgi:hypothetical protein
MSLLRSSKIFSTLSQRAAISSRSLSTTSSRFASGYGDGEGDPKGENPQDQGAPSHATTKREHPGPESPDTGKSSSPKSPEEASAQSGGSRSKEAEETGSSPTGGSTGGKDKNGASPKIHDRDQPGANSSEKQAEVDKHNKDFEKRPDRATSA